MNNLKSHSQNSRGINERHPKGDQVRRKLHLAFGVTTTQLVLFFGAHHLAHTPSLEFEYQQTASIRDFDAFEL
jgi:hypothetical protein